MGVDKLKLLMGRPILVNKENNIYVHQPKVSQIVDMGEDAFNELVLPYILTTEAVFNGVDNEEELIEKFSLFELFFMKIEDNKTILDSIFGNKNAMDVLTDSLKFFLNSDEIRVLEKRRKIVVDKHLIDENEFNKIRRIIQDVVGKKDVEVEKPPKNMTKRQKDIWTKLQKGRRRTAERNAIYLQDIINYISFGGKSYISTEKIDSMTYFYMQNAYKSIVGVDSFNIGMGYKLSQKFDVKDEIKHWMETIKIGK